MKQLKDTIKDLGSTLQRNKQHEAELRHIIASRAERIEVQTKRNVLKPLLFTGASIFAVVLIAVSIAPRRYDYPVYDYAFEESEDFAATTGLSEAGGIGDGLDSILSFGEESYYAPPTRNIKDQDILDFEDDNGQMLDRTSTFSLLTREDDALTATEELFNSVGGHISMISSYSSKSATVSGLVPANSFFLFREELLDMVRNDNYIRETLNATDLIPSAMSLDESIAASELTIEELEQKIAEEKNDNKRADLEQQLQDMQIRLENLNESRDQLDDQVDLVAVSVTITELEGFWNAGDYYELEQLLNGYEEPGFIGRAWLNVIYVMFWLIQALSVTFWLVIPLAIWLLTRRKKRNFLRELE